MNILEEDQPMRPIVNYSPWHEHIFSPLMDPDTDDIHGRFDAVEDETGRIFVLDVGRDEVVCWCRTREEAVAAATDAAAAWERL